MKCHFVIILACILFFSPVQAGQLNQWGVKAGYTGATQIWEVVWDIEWIDLEEISWRSGFHVGIYTEWFDYWNFSLIAGLNLEQKGMNYWNITTRYYFLSVPVLVKYSIKTKYFNPYILAGPRMDINIDIPYMTIPDPWMITADSRDSTFGLSAGIGLERFIGSRNILVEFVYNYDPSFMWERDDKRPGKSIRIKNESFNISVGLGF